MKQLCILVMLLALAGCATQSGHINRPPTMDDAGNPPPPQVHNPPVVLPLWFIEPPQSNQYAIGMARVSTDEDAMRQAAREYATVCRARNLSSYNVNKFIRVLCENDVNNCEDTARFGVLVSSQTDLREQCEQLKLVDEARFDGYYIALYAIGTTPASVHGQPQSMPPTVHPEWYAGDLVCPVEGEVRSSHRASAADLLNAVDLAIAGARVQLSRYADLDVQGEVNFETVDGDGDTGYSLGRKAIAMETVVEMGEVRIKRLHVTRRSQDGLYSYEVFAELAL